MVVSWRRLQPGRNAAERVLASQGAWLAGFCRRRGADDGPGGGLSDQAHVRPSVRARHHPLRRHRQYGKFYRHARRSPNGRILAGKVQTGSRRRTLRLSEKAGERLLAGPLPRRQRGHGKGSGHQGQVMFGRIGPKTTKATKRRPVIDREICQMRENLERAKGLEPSTPTLARSCSTTELHPHPRWRRTRAVNGRRMTNADRECNRRDALRCRAGLRFYQQMAANRSETAPRRSLAAAYREPGLVTRFGLRRFEPRPVLQPRSEGPTGSRKVPAD